jgi:hypothetical protein
MKKMILFTSLITTLTAAGTVLAMTGNPVKAALTDNSDATLKIDTLDEVLELTSVPHFDFGEHSTSALSSGLTDHLGDNTSDELSVYHVTAETDNYVVAVQLGHHILGAGSKFVPETIGLPVVRS